MDFCYTAVATVYNDAQNVVQLLDDICNQTLRPVEVIIADGGSTDSTVDEILEYAKMAAITIRVLSGKRLNISQGLNATISLCNSEWISIFAIGNHYENKFVECLYNEVNTSQLDIAYSLIRGCGHTAFSHAYNVAYGYDVGADQGIASNHGVLVKKDVFQKIGLFYEYFYYAGEDAEFFERAKRAQFRISPVKSAVAYWEVPSSMHEFSRQLKVYTIAQLQYFSLLRIFRSFARHFKFLLRSILSVRSCANSEADRIMLKKHLRPTHQKTLLPADAVTRVF